MVVKERSARLFDTDDLRDDEPPEPRRDDAETEPAVAAYPPLRRSVSLTPSTTEPEPRSVAPAAGRGARLGIARGLRRRLCLSRGARRRLEPVRAASSASRRSRARGGPAIHGSAGAACRRNRAIGATTGGVRRPADATPRRRNLRRRHRLSSAAVRIRTAPRPDVRPSLGSAAPHGHPGRAVDAVARGVTVNGQWRGRTPLTLEKLPFGRYVVRVVQPGYVVAREEVTLTGADASRTLDARLQQRNGGRRRPAPQRPEPTPIGAGAPRIGRRLYRVALRRFAAARRARLRRRQGGRADAAERAGCRIGSHVVRLEMAGSQIVDGDATRVPPARSPRHRITRTVFNESNARTRKRHLVRRGRRGRAGRDRRRSRLQHQHDRLPGNPDRSVVRRDRSSR